MTMSYPQTQPIHAFNIGRGLRSPSAFLKLQLYLFFEKNTQTLTYFVGLFNSKTAEKRSSHVDDVFRHGR